MSFPRKKSQVFKSGKRGGYTSVPLQSGKVLFNNCHIFWWKWFFIVLNLNVFYLTLKKFLHVCKRPVYEYGGLKIASWKFSNAENTVVVKISFRRIPLRATVHFHKLHSLPPRYKFLNIYRYLSSPRRRYSWVTACDSINDLGEIRENYSVCARGEIRLFS